MKNLKEKLLCESVVDVSDYDFDKEFHGKYTGTPTEIKLKFTPIVEYCYFIDNNGEVMDWVNDNGDPNKVLTAGTFYFKCIFTLENKTKLQSDIKVWAIMKTNYRGDITDIKINRSGIDVYSPIGFNELADLLYQASDEYAIGYFENKDEIIQAFKDCKLYVS